MLSRAYRAVFREITYLEKLTMEKYTTGCKSTGNYIRYLEHVEVIISLSFTRRGDITIHITSPQGTRSTLLTQRMLDDSDEGFGNWSFMSTHFWEENPRGMWTLEIKNVGDTYESGYLTSWQLRLHGIQDAPQAHHAKCSSECKGGCHGSSARDCVECANYKSDGVCVHECHENEYVSDEVTKECRRCHSACQTCYGPADNECTSCKEPKVLNNGNCVTSCPDEPGCDKECKKNEYRDYDDVCQPCHPSCLTCDSGGEWSCTECGNTISTVDHVKQNLYLSLGRCVTTCPTGYYGNNHECASCDTSCSTCCTGPLYTDCTSCKDDSGCEGDCATDTSLSSGAIAGIVIAAVVAVVALIVKIVCIVRIICRRNTRNSYLATDDGASLFDSKPVIA